MSKNKSDKTEEFEVEEDPSQPNEVAKAKSSPKAGVARPTSVRVERLPPPKEYVPRYREYDRVNTTSDLGKAMKKPGFHLSIKGMLALLIVAFVIYKGFFSEPKFLAFLIQETATSTVGQGEVQIETDVVGFEVFWDGNYVTTYNNHFDMPAGKEGELRIKRVGYEDFITKVVPQQGKVTLVRPIFTQEKRMGFFTYETVPKAKLTLTQNGRIILETETPVTGHKIPVGKYKALVENDFIGYRVEEEIVIEEWKTTSIRRQISHK